MRLNAYRFAFHPGCAKLRTVGVGAFKQGVHLASKVYTNVPFLTFKEFGVRWLWGGL